MYDAIPVNSETISRRFTSFIQIFNHVSSSPLAADFSSPAISRSKHGEESEWTSKDLLKGLEELVPIYDTRPIKNMYGISFDHRAAKLGGGGGRR